jgi:hypothetical protein
LAVRFATLFTLAAALFLVAWTLGYYWLPEGSLSGYSGVPAAVGRARAPTVFLEWLKLAGWNLIPMAAAVVANMVFRVRGVPLGYVVVLIPAVNYGLTLGTNSFVFPMPERVAPSLVVFERAGPYEFAAMMLVAAATYALSRFEINSLAQTEWKRNPEARGLTPGEWLGVVLGVILLFGAAWREASMIFDL